MRHVGDTYFLQDSKGVEESTLWYMENFERVGDKVPTLAGLACHLKTSLHVIHGWRRTNRGQRYSRFRLLADMIETVQIRYMLNGLHDGNAAMRSVMAKDQLTRLLDRQSPLPRKNKPREEPQAEAPKEAAPEAKAEAPANVSPISEAQRYADRIRGGS